MTWLEEVINAFEHLGGQAHVQEIYQYFRENSTRQLDGFWKESIRKNIQINSSSSMAHNKSRDIFETVNGINNGVWRLRNHNVQIPIPPDLRDDQEKFPKKLKSEVYRFQRDTKMVKELKILYQNRCQLCGIVIRIKNQYYSEGHHLQPLGRDHKGPDVKANILILCPNHHVEFDYGMIGIKANLQIVHVDSTQPIHGRLLDQKHNVNSKYIEYHLEKIYDQYVR